MKYFHVFVYTTNSKVAPPACKGEILVHFSKFYGKVGVKSYILFSHLKSWLVIFSLMKNNFSNHNVSVDNKITIGVCAG